MDQEKIDADFQAWLDETHPGIGVNDFDTMEDYVAWLDERQGLHERAAQMAYKAGMTTGRVVGSIMRDASRETEGDAAALI